MYFDYVGYICYMYIELFFFDYVSYWKVLDNWVIAINIISVFKYII